MSVTPDNILRFIQRLRASVVFNPASVSGATDAVIGVLEIVEYQQRILESQQAEIARLRERLGET